MTELVLHSGASPEEVAARALLSPEHLAMAAPLTAGPAEWLPGFEHVDLSGIRGNGWFGSNHFAQDLKGVCLHVNDTRAGTWAGFYRAGTDVNPASVCPNFQVGYSRSQQLLPMRWSPWCQGPGNAWYGAIETQGVPGEPLNTYQLQMCARIAAAYHAFGVPLVVADHVGQRGLIYHGVDNGVWDHPYCPGTLRKAQRPTILRLAAGGPQPNTWDELAHLIGMS